MTKFRPIEGKDREAVRGLIEGTGAFNPHEVDAAMELVDEVLAQPGQDDDHPFVLEEEDGTVVAYACFGKNPMTKATFDLDWLATRADRMGKEGYGRRIVALVEEEVRRRGGKLLVIETSSHGSCGGTREFYLEIGCTLVAQLPDYYDEGDDMLIYLKRIL